jgi:putative two-component system response regulator
VGYVLIVDDTIARCRSLAALLTPDDYDVRTADDGAGALRGIRADRPDLVLMAVTMPGVNGFQVCRALKQDPSTWLIPVVLVSSFPDTTSRLRGIEAGADDFITEPIDALELRARVRSLLRIKHRTDELDSAQSVMVSLAMTIEARDETTAGHCQRLAAYASALGIALGLDDEDTAALIRGGYLHDLGKVAIADAVLLKPGPLSADEFTRIKQHTIIGDRLCGDLRSLQAVRPIVRHHHEHLDGSGYPDGLRGDQTPLLAQIMGIVDVFDALTSERPYRGALPFGRAAEELRGEVARGWRRGDLVTAFLDQVGPSWAAN